MTIHQAYPATAASVRRRDANVRIISGATLPVLLHTAEAHNSASASHSNEDSSVEEALEGEFPPAPPGYTAILSLPPPYPEVPPLPSANRSSEELDPLEHPEPASEPGSDSMLDSNEPDMLAESDLLNDEHLPATELRSDYELADNKTIPYPSYLINRPNRPRPNPLFLASPSGSSLDLPALHMPSTSYWMLPRPVPDFCHWSHYPRRDADNELYSPFDEIEERESSIKPPANSGIGSMVGNLFQGLRTMVAGGSKRKRFEDEDEDNNQTRLKRRCL